jgi:RNA polymerase sigma-70 factor (ECF subfamily)
VLKTETRKQFAEGLIAHLPGLRRYAMVLVGNASAADDLVQDCIERALRQHQDLRDRQRLAGWLRSILHNLYVDELRRRRSRGVEEDIANLIDDGALSVPAGDPGAFRDFVAAMNALSVEHRQILLLVGLEGLNYREISEELKIPLGTVMSRLARARERLRSALESGGERPGNVTPLMPQRRGSP